MSRLKLAASNIAWEAADDEHVMQLMSTLGFEGLEIAPTRVFPDDPYSRCRDFHAYAESVREKYGLSVCSMQSIWHGRPENIFDENGALALLDYTSRACKFAEAGKVHNLVFGCPRNRSVPKGRDIKESVPFLTRCGELAAASGAVFAIEANPPIYGTNYLNSTKDVLGFLNSMPDSTGLGVNLDIGAILGMNESIDVAMQAIPLVSHVHVSAPQLAPIRRQQLHVELRAVLEDAHYDGYVSLEMGRADFDVLRECLELMAETFLG